MVLRSRFRINVTLGKALKAGKNHPSNLWAILSVFRFCKSAELNSYIMADIVSDSARIGLAEIIEGY